jgi:hypothetical protein
MVGVEIFITMGCCCACAAPNGSAIANSAPAATAAGIRKSRFLKRMWFSLWFLV